jgi:hypothetical protein
MSIDFSEEFDQDIDDKEFGIWIENGINRGWISKPFCYTHEGDPYMTEEEAKEWEEGQDPCSFVIKLIEI